MTKTALLFAGQGAQTVGMGQDLAEQFPKARALFDRANEVLGYDLARICLDGPEPELTRTEHAQPGIYLVSWIAFELLRDRLPGFEFHAAAGLSLGEFTALAAAKAISFESGLDLVHQRGRFMQEACDLTRGAMAAILGLSEEVTRQICLDAGVELANLNCPGQIVISGETDRLQQACELALAQGAMKTIPLPVAGAYHSRLMQSAAVRLESALATIPLQSPGVTVLSNVTARPHLDPHAIATQLVQQVTAPVRWEMSMRHLLEQGFNRFIELGPGRTLTGFLKRIDRKVNVLNIGDVPSFEQTVSRLTAPSAA